MNINAENIIQNMVAAENIIQNMVAAGAAALIVGGRAILAVI